MTSAAIVSLRISREETDLRDCTETASRRPIQDHLRQSPAGSNRLLAHYLPRLIAAIATLRAQLALEIHIV